MKLLALLIMLSGCTTTFTAREIWDCLYYCHNEQNGSKVRKVGKHTLKGNCCECSNGYVHFFEKPKERIGMPEIDFKGQGY